MNMSKIADALKKANQERISTISPVREGKRLSMSHSRAGKIHKSWLIWIVVVAVVTVFAVFNYQEGKDAVPLSEIFPDEEVFPVDVAYEFMPEEIVPSKAEEVAPVVEKTRAVIPAAPVIEVPVEVLASVNSAPTEKMAAYTVQIASFKNKKRAEEALVNIKGKVPSAYMASRDLGEKGTWYRIYAGHFDQRSEAEVTLSDIKQNFDGSFIISPKGIK